MAAALRNQFVTCLGYGTISNKAPLKCTNTIKNQLQSAVEWLNVTLPCQARKKKLHTREHCMCILTHRAEL